MKRVACLLGVALFTACAKSPPPKSATTEATPTPIASTGPTPSAAHFAEMPGPEARTPSEFRRLVQKSLKQIESNPRDYDAYVRLGKLYSQLNQLQDAARAFENASLVKPTETAPMLTLADVYLRAGQAGKAVPIYQGLLAKNPKSWTLKNNLAVAYRLKRDYVNALSIIREILNTDRTNIFAINNLGLIYYDTQRYPLAELTFQKGKKLSPKTAETFNNLGITYLAMGLTQNAVAEFRQAKELGSGLVTPRLNLGNLYLSYNNYPLAMSAYQEVLNIDPLNITANLNVGVAYLAIGKTAEARQTFANITEIDPKASAPLFNLGILYQNYLKDGESALRYYQKFVALERNLPSTHEVFNFIKQARSMPKRPTSPAAQPTSKGGVKK